MISLRGTAVYEEKERQSHHHYRYRTLFRRALYSLALVAGVLLIGTLGFHYIEGYSYVDAFYFTSMLATAEGPAGMPATTIGKIFASVMAFVSVGAVIFALAFLFGPFFGKLVAISDRKIQEEEQEFQKEEQKLSKSARKYEKRL